ncbi:hypothetical protein EJB05_25632, partial [Eragrostis curvula]
MEEDNPATSSLVDLYCHEPPLVSTPPSPPAAAAAAASSAGDDHDDQQVQDEEGLHDLIEEYMAGSDATRRAETTSIASCSHLPFLMACPPRDPEAYTTSSMLGLTATTAFNAVNYLDRFLSINCHLRWETWMVELVSVACLSIASKLDEVNVPSLHHLQMEEVMSHSFRPATIRDMELTLLKALQWRIACVTPFSFLQLLLPPCGTPAVAASRCTRLLIHSLSESSLLRFEPSVVATSALRCVALQLQVQDRHQADATYNISHLISPECPLDKDTDECFNMMKTLHASLDQMFSDQQQSPVSVSPIETDGTVNRSAVSRRLFGGSIPQVGTEDEDTIPPDTQGMK